MLKILKFLCSYKYTLICSFYLGGICYLFDKNFLTSFYGLLIILNIVSILIIINILGRIKYTFFATLIFSFFVAFDAYFAYTYHNPIFLGGLASIFETNLSEAKEALGQVVFPATIIFLLSFFLIYMSQKELKKSQLLLKKSIILLTVYLIIIIPVSYFFIISKVERLRQEFSANPILTLQRLSLQTLPLVYNDWLTFIAYRQEMSKFHKYGKEKRVLPNGIYLNKNNLSPEKIFLIIGESSWRKHYSLYGYSVVTTPFLDSLNKEKNVDFKYYDAISPAPITREALRIVLSFSTQFTIQPFFREKNIVELANDAGYETIWISNQDQIGMFESYVGFISSGATEQYFPESQVRNKKNHDLVLLNILKKNYNKKKKQFFVIHLMGSHILYNERYDSADMKAIKKSEDFFTIDYDRSIHQTDRVLRGVNNLMKNSSSSLMIYFSDHGEKIWKGHGFMEDGTPQFEIPYITVNKSNFDIDNVILKYINKNTQLLNSSCSIYVLAEALGYHVPDKYKKQAIYEGRYIFHVDSQVYPYSKIQREDNRL